MKKNNLFTITLIALSCLTGSLSAQETITHTPDIEALTGLMPLDPFKITPEQGGSLDLGNMTDIYFEDGNKLTQDKIARYLAAPDYILIPYVKPSDKNKVVAALIRKSTSEEREAQKEIREKMGMPMSATDMNNRAMNDPEAFKNIDFDPHLKKDEFIKDLKQQPRSKTGGHFVNPGKVAHFDENGNLIPLVTGTGNNKSLNPEFQKYLTNRDLTHDAYTDEKGEIKAIVYRRATEEEKKNRKTIMSAVSMEEREGKPAERSAGAGLVPGSSDRTAIGTELMDFSSKDIKGNPVTLSKYKGKKVVVLNFWFISCPPCRQEIPLLNKLVEQYQGKEVEFISFCNDNIPDINNFLKKQKFNYRIIPDAFKLANRYKVEGYPTHIVIDKNSKVAFFQTGLGPGIENDISAAIKKCLK